MLRVTPKGSGVLVRPIAPDEDRLLRAAFGRHGGRAEARAAAAPVVARYQQLSGGYWFACDCRPDAERPPALVPVAQAHIRRHLDGSWPPHAEDCDFYCEPAEQATVTASFAPTRDRPLRLARAFGVASAPLDRVIVARSRNTRLPGIAHLLMRLVTDAGFQRIDADWSKPGLADQAAALWRAAGAHEIDAGVQLPEFFCTSAVRLDELKAKIAAADPARFARNRPHGVLVARINAVDPGVLRPFAGEPIPVRGRLAIFAERPPAERGIEAESSARAPYLALIVFGRASAEAPVEALSAYAHPCADPGHGMLVDSDLERQTLAELRRVQDWLRRRQDVEFSIEKPLFDLGPAPGQAPDARPPCIPDFILRREPANGARRRAIVETMGFADPAYRERKLRMHVMMSEALSAAPVVMHDFHEPADRPQAWRNEWFCQAVRAAMSGIAR